MRMSRGFTLVELALGLALGGIVLAGVWQLMGVSGRRSEATALSGHALAVARAGNSYLSANSTAVLAQLAAINNVVKIRVTSADSGNGTLTDLQTAGYLPAAFVNQNSYGQSYAFYAQRQDAGAAGADASDRLVGLVITTGGNAISDNVGDVVVQRLGAAGGFMYASDNPAPPTAATTARGAGGGWSLNLSGAGWTTTVGATATAGGLAVVTNMLSNAGAAGGAAAKSINELEDGVTDYTRANVFMGQGSGSESVSGSNNTAMGVEALDDLTSGSNNSAFGYRALADLTTGSNNTAFGSRALEESGASNNTAIGAEAMRYGNSAAVLGANTAVGFQALRGSAVASANTGISNTAVGAGVMLSNTTGSSNLAVGHHATSGAALASNLNGDENVAIGGGAMNSTVSSSRNIAVGVDAMRYYDTTSRGTATVGYNIAVGHSALSPSSAPGSAITGTSNIALGRVLRNLTTGNSNIAVGSNALGLLTTASDIIGIGQNAAARQAAPVRAIGIGFDSLSFSPTFIGEDLLGIGVNALGYADSSVSPVPGTAGPRNVAIGFDALTYSFEGGYNVGIGRAAGATGGGPFAPFGNASGQYNTYIGFEVAATGTSFNNSTGLGQTASINASNQIVLGNNLITEIRAQVTSITAISDRRLKRDIAALPLGLEFIRRLQPVQYRNDNGDEKLRFGFLAQDVKEALPKELQPMAERDIDGLALLSRDRAGGRYYHMAYGELAAPLVKSIQEMTQRLEKVKRTLAAIKAENEQMQRELAAKEAAP